MRRIGLALSAVLAVLPSVAQAAPPAPPAARAELLALADSRRFDEDRLRELGRHQDAGVRGEVARVLGELANPGALPLLQRLAKDEVVAVRAETAASCGRLSAALGEGDKATGKFLALVRDALEDGAPTVRAAAGWACGMAGTPAAGQALLARLAVEGSTEARIAMLAELWRFKEQPWLPLAERALADPRIEVREAAAWSVARSGRDDAEPLVRRLLAAKEPALAALGYDGARRLGPGRFLPELAAAVGSDVPRVRRAALATLGAMVTPGKLPEAADRALTALVAAADPTRVHERVLAIRAAAAVRTAEAPLRDALAAGEPWVSGEALQALARMAAPGAGEAIAEWARSDDVARRVAAVRAAAQLPAASAVVLAGFADPAPAVRLTAVEAVGVVPAGEASAALVAALVAALADGDVAVRAAAVEGLEGREAMPAGEVLRARLAAERPAKGPDAAVALVGALTKGKELPPETRTMLEELLRGSEPVTARAAWQALREHGVERPLPVVATGRDAAFYERVVAWTATPRWLEVVTVRGTLLVALGQADAPLACFSLVQLAGSGFFENLIFHRVVPDFVSQGGDPRGDGWGGPGFALRDELTLAPYAPGVVGMALSGPDTGGSQLFVTLTAQPHLRGRYPIVGRVVAGLDVAERLRVGDRILRVKVAEGTAPHVFPVWYGPLDPARLDHEIEGWAAERQGYKPDARLVALLATATLRYGLEAAAGTWCGDSREQLPRLQAVLGALGPSSPFEELRMVGIDRSKSIDVKVWPFGTVELVPTIVVTMSGAEVGRITETPATGSIERDLATILAPLEGWEVPHE